MNDTDRELTAAMKTVRKLHGMTLVEFGKLWGLTGPSIHQREKGRVKWNRKRLAQLLPEADEQIMNRWTEANRAASKAWGLIDK